MKWGSCYDHIFLKLDHNPVFLRAICSVLFDMPSSLGRNGGFWIVNKSIKVTNPIIALWVAPPWFVYNQYMLCIINCYWVSGGSIDANKVGYLS